MPGWPGWRSGSRAWRGAPGGPFGGAGLSRRARAAAAPRVAGSGASPAALGGGTVVPAASAAKRADGLAGRLPRYAYFPFGAGPRVRIGTGFALTEGVLLLATIAQRFRLSLEPGPVVTPQPFVTLRPKDDVRTVLRRR